MESWAYPLMIWEMKVGYKDMLNNWKYVTMHKRQFTSRFPQSSNKFSSGGRENQVVACIRIEIVLGPSNHTWRQNCADLATAPVNNRTKHKITNKTLTSLLNFSNKSQNSKQPIIQSKPKIPNNKPKSPTQLVTNIFCNKHLPKRGV